MSSKNDVLSTPHTQVGVGVGLVVGVGMYVPSCVHSWAQGKLSVRYRAIGQATLVGATC